MTPERIDDPRDQAAQPCAAANPAGASRLQSLRPVRRVAELGSSYPNSAMKLLAVLILTCGIATTKAASPHPLVLAFMYPRGVNGPEGTNSIGNSGTNG